MAALRQRLEEVLAAQQHALDDCEALRVCLHVPFRGCCRACYEVEMQQPS